MPGAQEKNKALVRRFYLDALEELLALDFVDHSLLPGQDPGREGYIQLVAEAHFGRMFSRNSSQIHRPTIWWRQKDKGRRRRIGRRIALGG